MTEPNHLEPPELLARSSSGKLPYAMQESLHWIAGICGVTEGVATRRMQTQLFLRKRTIKTIVMWSRMTPTGTQDTTDNRLLVQD
jgi:hypothetical protein